MVSSEQKTTNFTKPASPVVLIMTASLLFISVLTACMRKPLFDPYDLVLGTWKTEKGIVMSIEMTPEGTARASIKVAPGYGGEDVRIGRVIISSIKPEPSGGYYGLFIMPGELKAVKVEISVLRRNTMIILSRDRRVKGSRMVWKRVMGTPDKRPE